MELRHDAGQALRRPHRLAVHAGDDRAGRQPRGRGRAVADRADDQGPRVHRGDGGRDDQVGVAAVAARGAPVPVPATVPEPVAEAAEAVVLLLLLLLLLLLWPGLRVAARRLRDVLLRCCSTLIGQLSSALHRCRVARDHNLIGRINIRRRADFTLRRVLANRGNFLEFHAQDCRHRAHSHRDRLLHILSTIAYGTHCVGKAHRARSHVCRILAEAVARHKTRLGDAALKNPQGRNRRGENRRLRDLGEPQLLFRSLKAYLRQLVAQRLVGFFKRLPRDGILLGEILAHADGLRSLAGKNECDLQCDSR